ncbi:MAG: SDR family oxidoreductase [Williamsia herbipolensis]|uniref:SDR family oxidoreductase n=1 Tax=Williamsia serinedens TaxID=391736 RepID=UPI0019E74959|nr:SDR family oxidoreductase [Williamsia serinedens]MBE7160859.1 SDR family oxidoreductase [Williamsia herbipolensis]
MSTASEGAVRRVLVTGVSSGIGAEVARLLVARGHEVIGTSRRPDSIAEDARVPGVRYITLDQTEPASIAACVAEAGDVDVLINNAGVSHMGPLEDVPMKSLENVFATNVFGPIALTKAFLPGMRARRRGTIVMVGSMLGSFPLPFRSVYGATKSAIKAFSDAMRRELAPFGIAITTVEPGTIATGIGDRRIYDVADDSAYRADYDTVAAATRRNEEKGLAVEPMAKVIVEAALAANPKPLYALGNNASVVFALKRILPTQAMLDVMSRFHGLRRARP